MTEAEGEYTPLVMFQLDDACYQRCKQSDDCDLGNVGDIVERVAELRDITGTYFRVTCDGPEFTRFRKQVVCNRIVSAIVKSPESEC